MTPYVFRRLLRSPGFTAATLLTLAIGIGANTAVFSVVDAILLKPLPYPQPDRLVGLWHTAAGLNLNEVNLCSSLYFTYREENRSFEKVGAYTGGTVSVTRSGPPEELRSFWVTQEVLPILGVRPALGRIFSRRDDTPGMPRTVVLTWGYWHTHFGDSASAIGRHIVTDGRDREIVGVLPRDFRFIDPQPDIVLPLQFERDKALLGNFSYQGIARLKAGVTVSQAGADIARMIPIWLRTFPAPPGFSRKIFEDARLAPHLLPFTHDVIGDIGNSLWMVMGTIGAVLLIACANVANLLLVRAEGRRHELSIRAALGAGQGRIARELLLESSTLALAGGLLGLAFAYGALKLLVALAPSHLPRLGEIGIDPATLLFALAASLFAGVLFGILPVMKYAGARAATGLRDDNRSVSAGRERHRARNILVVVQVALALLLLIASGLMIRTFQSMRSIEPGFSEPADVLTMRIAIPAASVTQPERAVRMDYEIATKIAAIPGVESVGLANANTMDGNNSNDLLYVENQPVANGTVPPVRTYKFVSPGFFRTVGRRFLAGRDLTWNDVFDYRAVAIVSENLAREYWRTPSAALGKRIREGGEDEWREVVGVVADERDNGVQMKPPTIVYWPFTMKKFWGEETFAQRTMAFDIRSKRTGSEALLNEVRRAVWSVSPNSPLANVQSLDRIYGMSMARTSFTLAMLGIAGAMALILGIVGIYGAISYSVSQRRREIGIRVALGAREREVSGMFVRHGLGLAAIGVVCGIVAAASLKRVIAAMLFGVGPVDPATYAVMSAALIGAAALASYVPARRAAAVNPVETLRAE